MQKTAHYRRAVWVVDQPTPLASVIREGLENVGDDVIPTFKTSDGDDCVVARRSVSQEPLFLHLVTYEKGAPAAVIAAITAAPATDAATADPPDGMEFIQSQLFCLLRGDHVVWTAHNTPLREGAINGLFYSLIESHVGQGDKTQFQLQAKLDRNAFKKAFDKGIAEIDLGLGDFKPTLEALIEDGKISGMNPLKSLVSVRPSDAEIEAASKVSGTVVLRSGRQWDKPQVKELLSDMASNVLANHEEEFVIVTKNGVRLTRKKMAVHKDYDAHGTKQVLSAADVQSKLANVLADLDESGLLEDA